MNEHSAWCAAEFTFKADVDARCRINPRLCLFESRSVSGLDALRFDLRIAGGFRLGGLRYGGGIRRGERIAQRLVQLLVEILLAPLLGVRPATAIMLKVVMLKVV